MPEQIAPVAQKLGLTVAELFKKYLTIDAVLHGEQGRTTGIYVFAPAIVGEGSGSVSNPTARGTCVWFIDGKCAIHDLKPRECAMVDHSTAGQDIDMLRASMVKEWKTHRKIVQQLYGRKLKPPNALKEKYREIRRGDEGRRQPGSGEGER